MSLARLFPCLASLCFLGLRADFHVAPDGSDSNPGTRSQPFATLERARDALRGSRARNPVPSQGSTVWIHAGDHFRTQTLVLGPADSGTPLSPVAWRAWHGSAARLMGGRRIGTFAPVTDAKVLDRLAPEARRHVIQADLRKEGLPSAASLASRGFSRPLVDAHSELFHGGRPMPLARWPNDGQWDRIDGFPEIGRAHL